MKTKVKPTVEKWEPKYYAVEYRHNGNVTSPVLIPADEIEPLLTEADGVFREPLYTKEQLASSVQEAKAERDREILQWLQDEGEISQYDKERLLASLKQEEEHD